MGGWVGGKSTQPAPASHLYIGWGGGREEGGGGGGGWWWVEGS